MASNPDRPRSAGQAWMNIHKNDPRAMESVQNVRERMRLYSKLFAEAYKEIEADIAQWEAAYGLPYPRDIDGWIDWAQYFNPSLTTPEVLRMSGADFDILLPQIQGHARRLLDESRESKSKSSVRWLPASWYQSECGITPGALRQRAIRAQLDKRKSGSRNLYRLDQVKELWPDAFTD
ncbi:MAG: hypothetical protein KDA29_01050 [Phycisphaerales bacterium]|nr:hypothetical protein [Phycisphaerales bacterium]